MAQASAQSMPLLREILEECNIACEINDYLIDEHIGSTEELLTVFHSDLADFHSVLERVGVSGSEKQALVAKLESFPRPQIPLHGGQERVASSGSFGSLEGVQYVDASEPTDAEIDEGVGMHAGAARKMRNN